MEGKVEEVPEYISGRWQLDRVQKRSYRGRPLCGHPWKADGLAEVDGGRRCSGRRSCMLARERESSLSKNQKSSCNQHVSPQSVPGIHGNVTNQPFLQHREWIGGYKIGYRETKVVVFIRKVIVEREGNRSI